MKSLKYACPTPESIVGCKNCPFKTKRIGGRGPIDSPFVIVGESPGSNELARNVPFVGASGHLVKEIMEEMQFDSLGIEPYVTNALSCYPMDKTIPKMQSATSCCQGRLHQELAMHPREVILCFGAAAAWAVTGDYGIKITRDRGKILPSKFTSKGVVLAVHPAYLMRNGAGLPFWKKDIGSAVELAADTLQSFWREPDWRVLRTRQELEWVVRSYTNKPDTLVTGDFETTGLNALFNEVLMLGITRDAGNHVDIIPEELWYANLDLIKVLMEHPNIKWNWHNGKFDIQWAWASNPQYQRILRKKGLAAAEAFRKTLFDKPPYINARVDEDTMLLSYALNENSGFHDLDQVAQAWIGAPSHKTVMTKYYKMAPHFSLRNAPKEELERYGAFDIAKTHKVWKPLREALAKDKRLVRLYEHTLIPASGFFARMEYFGIAVDKDQVKENIHLIDGEIKRLNDKLQTYAKDFTTEEINFNSYLQVRKLLFGYLKLGPKGCDWRIQPSDEQALIDVQRKTNHPIVHDLLEYREVVKRKGTFIVNLIDHWKKPAGAKKPHLVKGLTSPDGRVHASFKIHGTTTGRPACTAPNLLNQPRMAYVRNQYKARKGKVIVEVDLNQAELRSLCVLSGDPLLTKIYTENKVSIHDVTTSAFFGSKEDMAKDPLIMHKAADLMQYFGERTPSLVYKEAKMAGKTVNFGIVYGREAHSIAQVFNVSHQEAQRWIDQWLATYAVAGQYIERCRKTVIRNQQMVTPFGRIKRNGVVSPEKLHDLENQAANFPHQSIAHDILLEAAMECEPRLYEEWGARPWNEVYDAIYFEIDDDEQKVAAAIDYVCDVITQVPVRYGLTRIPFIGDAKVGPRWGSMVDWKGNYADSGLEI